MAQPERDRHLAEDVTRESLADHALQAVDEHDRLDPSREDAEQRPLVALVHGKLAGAERDIGRDTAEPLAVDRIEIREQLEPPDLLRGQHGRHPAERAF